MFKYYFLFLLFFSSQSLKSQNFYIGEYGLNTLDFSEKGDFKFSFFIPSFNQGGKFSLGYSPLKHLSFSAGFFNINAEEQFGEQERVYKGNIFTLSAGGYIQVLRKETDGKVKEVFLNSKIGFARGVLDTQIIPSYAEFDFEKYYAQLGVNYSGNPWGCGFYLKYNYLNYLNGRVGNAFNFSNLFDAIEEIDEQRYFSTMEVKFQVHYGKKFAKIILGGAMEMSLSGRDTNFLQGGQPFLGVEIEIDKIKRKK